MSQITSFGDGSSGSEILTVTGDSGGAVGPNGAGNINLVGAAGSGISVVGNPGTNTLEIDTSGVATTYTTDSGNAIPAAGILNVEGGVTAPNAISNINTYADPNGSNNLKIALNNSIFLPSTNAAGTTGVIYINSNLFAHEYSPVGGINNAFFGPNAGNLTLTTAIGNTGVGTQALTSLTTSDANTAIGGGALSNLTSGSGNNTAVGNQAAVNLTTGGANDFIGTVTALNLLTGSANVIIGSGEGGSPFPAGNSYTGSESSNILIRNVGVVGENNTIRIGTTGAGVGQQNRCFVAGIYNTSVGGAVASQIMRVNVNGQLGSDTGTNGQVLIAGGLGPVWANITSTGGTITITNNPNAINIETAATVATQYDTDAGSAAPAAGILEILGGSNINSSGAGNTVTVNLDNTVSISGSFTSGTTSGDMSVVNGNVNVGTTTPGNPYDIAVEKTVAGLIGMSIQNLSNNASAGVNVQHIVEPGAADAFSIYSVNGAATWSTGVDNSDSDAYKITTGSTPSGGTTVLSSTTAGRLTAPGVYDFDPTGTLNPVLTNSSGQLGSLTNYQVSPLAFQFFPNTISPSPAFISVQNLDNTSGTAHAYFFAQTGGASGGDPYVRLEVSGITNWSLGIDNSDSDAFVISQNANVGTNNVLRASTAGDISLPNIAPLSGTVDILAIDASDVIGTSPATFTATTTDLTWTGSSTAEREIEIINTDNTNSVAHARVSTSTGGASAGDPKMTFNVSGVASWGVGLDNSDSDAFVISGSTNLGTTNIMRASTAGEINYPLQPAFLARHNVAQDNVTGNGATVTVNFTQEIFDQNSDYDGTNTFTAPVTGRYQFNFMVVVDQISGITGALYTINTSNRSYIVVMNPASIVNSVGRFGYSMSVLADMDASDTCICQVTLSGLAGDTSDLPASTTQTIFSGYLVA